MKCCLCSKEIEKKKHPVTGEVYWDQGNNAESLANGICCSFCNKGVILARLREIQNDKKKV